MKPLTKADIVKIETGVRVLRDSLRQFGIGVELVCDEKQELPDGRIVSYACDVVEPYGWSPEECCPLHD